MEFTLSHTEPTQQLILCCQCGTQIPPNPANMCVNCVRNQVDITEGIPKQINANWCKNCERYLQPPTSWIVAQPESKELLALLIRKLKGLNKVRLVDASFLWTEPHSKRLKMKLTIQKEVFASTILQQIFQVEVVICSQMCPDCTKIMAQNTWKAVVQVRQKVAHKKSFFYLEQLILKHQAHRDTVNIKECKDGLDFFFAQRQHAIHFLSFLQSVVPIKSSQSQQLISSDIKSGTANFKFTYSAEIVPLCKDDLLVLPLKLARQMGNINPLVLCQRVSGGGVLVLDPRTLQLNELQNVVYWRSPFASLCEAGSKGTMAEYYVLDVEPIAGHQSRGSMVLADITVARCLRSGGVDGQAKEEELDIDMNQTFITRSHLGAVLKPGDYAYGYDLHSSNFNSDLYDELHSATLSSGAYHQIPDVLLVKKMYMGRRSRGGKSRPWRVKRISEGMEIEQDDDVKRQNSKRAEKEKREEEWEGFLRDLEEDKEMRGMINLYKNPNGVVPNSNTSSGEVDDAPEVDLAELLDEMEINDEEMPDAD